MANILMNKHKTNVTKNMKLKINNLKWQQFPHLILYIIISLTKFTKYLGVTFDRS